MSHEMECEDFVAQLRAEVESLREELHRVQIEGEAKDREIEELHKARVALSKDNLAMRKQLQSWADEADKEIQLANLRRAEVEACEL
jgi:ABC-type phosphate transport system auxiliary subunit